MRIAYAVLGLGIVAALFWPGEAIALGEASAPEEPILVTGESVNATITAFTSSPDETDGDPDITASGTTTGDGTIACPAQYDFGTKVQIEGKIYTCEDRMAARYRNTERFDIWLTSKHAAYQWGIRHLTIKIYGSKN